MGGAAMFDLRLSRSRTVRSLVSRITALLLVLLGGIAPAAAATGTATPSPQSDRPLTGPAAAHSVVDLRTLPLSVGTGTHPSALPFRHAGGAQALAAAQAAARRAPPTSGVQRPANTRSTLSLVRGFDGISSEESGGSGGPCYCVPPDGDIAVGPNHVVVDVNQAFRVFSKTGKPLTAPVGFDTFFTGCDAAGLVSSDPIAAYDPVADRFTVGILRYDATTFASYVDLAVAQTNVPTGSWNRYCFYQPYQGGNVFYDFPHLSVGQTALYTTGNLFIGEVQVAARVNAYPKAQMYAGAANVVQTYVDVASNSDGTPADTLRPALFNVGLPVPTNYFVNSSSAPGSSRVTLWRWTDPFGANAFQQAGGVDIAPYLQAVPMVQPLPGGAAPSGPEIDDRTLGAMWHNGTLYATHTIGCNPGGGTTDCIQWYQVGNLDGAPILLQQGIVGAANQSRAYPNLAVDRNGNVELAYAFSSLSDPIGIRHTGRLATDAPGTMGADSEVNAAEQIETGFNATRWADSAGSVLDPDGRTLWHFEEYSKRDANPFGAWGTWASATRFGR